MHKNNIHSTLKTVKRHLKIIKSFHLFSFLYFDHYCFRQISVEWKKLVLIKNTLYPTVQFNILTRKFCFSSRLRAGLQTQWPRIRRLRGAFNRVVTYATWPRYVELKRQLCWLAGVVCLKDRKICRHVTQQPSCIAFL
jgi:hypothetical protein